LANPTPQGSVWAAIWPWGMREACVIHWSGKQGAAGDGAGCAAWSGGARSPACGAWAPLWVTGYDNSCKRKRGPGCSSPSTGLDGGVTQRRRRRDPAAGRGRSSWPGSKKGASGCLAARIHLWRGCGARQGVRRVRCLPALRKFDGGRITCSGGSKGKFPRRCGPGSGQRAREGVWAHGEAAMRLWWG